MFLLLVYVCTQTGCDPPEKSTVDESIRHSVPAVVESQTDPVSEPEVGSELVSSPALDAFLPKFDHISARGFVPTMRRGSTGIGYTLENLLEIEENNSPKGDFMGMELKAWRDDGKQSTSTEKMNLFLKEPKWIDGLKSADRIRKYGYVDPKGREALYSTVTIETNSHQLGLSIDANESKVWLNFCEERVAYWDFDVLAKRLKEKHSETVFVSAHVRGEGSKEEFHYYGVNWCREPSVDEFVSLIKEGDVVLELRMHVKESGAARNHGSCFRVYQHRIKDLFKLSHQVRP